MARSRRLGRPSSRASCSRAATAAQSWRAFKTIGWKPIVACTVAGAATGALIGSMEATYRVMAGIFLALAFLSAIIIVLRLLGVWPVKPKE